MIVVLPLTARQHPNFTVHIGAGGAVLTGVGGAGAGADIGTLNAHVDTLQDVLARVQELIFLVWYSHLVDLAFFFDFRVTSTAVQFASLPHLALQLFAVSTEIPGYVSCTAVSWWLEGVRMFLPDDVASTV